MRKRNDPPRGRHVGCSTGKLAHVTRRGAKAMATSLHKATGDHLRPYLCAECHQWHIGHLPGQVLRGRKTASDFYRHRRAG